MNGNRQRASIVAAPPEASPLLGDDACVKLAGCHDGRIAARPPCAGGARHARRVSPIVCLLLVAAVTSVLGCGDSENGAGKRATVATTGDGVVVVSATDDAAGLHVQVENDGLLMQLADDAPASTRKVAGKTLGGACDVDGGGGIDVERQFPIYWREDFRDWGTELVRPLGHAEGEVLADHVTRCRIFEPTPTGAPGEAAFDESTDEPIATVSFR